jgi:ubiquinone/menaquinone biosynthesis C-methylase UbiE
MACHGSFSLDEATRRSWYNPEAILKATGAGKGTVFADIGCGEGFFTLLAAQLVGETGKIYAVDVDASAIENLKRKAAEKGLKNIHAVAGKAEDTIFCEKCADIVFYSMDLHDFNNPAKVLRNAKRMLKPSGLLVDLDWKKLEMSFGPPERIRFSEQQAQNLMEQADFKVESVKEAGRYHYVITAKPSH